MKRSEISTEVETARITLGLGFAPSEFLGATPESLRESAVIYKTLLDWVRSKGWHLSQQDILDIEATIEEKLPLYSRESFDHGDRDI